MNTNDTLLIKMIEMDMQNKAISMYLLSDEMLINPDQIKVGANEVLYVYLVGVIAQFEFNVWLTSATSVIQLTPLNTESNISTQITNHLGNITIKKANPETKTYVRFIRVTMNK